MADVLLIHKSTFPSAPDNVTPVASAGAAGERITPSGPPSCQISWWMRPPETGMGYRQTLVVRNLYKVQFFLMKSVCYKCIHYII